MKLTFLNMLGGDFAFEVHAKGCRDIARKRINGSWNHEAASAEEAVANEVADFEDQDQGWKADDFRIFPCCMPRYEDD